MVLRLLAFPVTGPIKLIGLVADEAAKQWYDPAVVVAEFQDLKRRHTAGEVDDETYEERKHALNERLLIGRQRAAAGK